MYNHRYVIGDTEDLLTPQLVYYKDILRENIEKMIKIAGGSERLWPHVKSHKMASLVSMQIGMGITKFKCATIAEAEMAAECGASKLILAYPLIGPNISRFLKLMKAFPKTEFYAIGDDYESLKWLGKRAEEIGVKAKTLIDVNMGTNRTGVEIDSLYDFYRNCATLPGLLLCGLHCYDGNHGIEDYGARKAAVDSTDQRVFKVVERLGKDGMPCDILVMGGTPSFPCHAVYDKVYLSPGTGIISDYGYASRFQDEDFIPAGILATRVISHPAKGYFTLDLGYKGIAADPPGVRGKLLGVENAVSVNQNEEHWIWKMEEGKEKRGRTPCGRSGFVCDSNAYLPNKRAISCGSCCPGWEDHRVVGGDSA